VVSRIGNDGRTDVAPQVMDVAHDGGVGHKPQENL